PLGGSWLNMTESVNASSFTARLTDKHPSLRRTSWTGSKPPLAVGTRTRHPLSGAVAVTLAASALICAVILWVAPVLAPHVPSAVVLSLALMPVPVPSDPLVLSPAAREHDLS